MSTYDDILNDGNGARAYRKRQGLPVEESTGVVDPKEAYTFTEEQLDKMLANGVNTPETIVPEQPKPVQPLANQGFLDTSKAKEGIKPKPMTYTDMFKIMNTTRPMTVNERKEDVKRRKRQAMFAALGDGISALSNLYFTTQGAPSSYSGNTLSAKQQARYDALRKERQTNERQYYNDYLNAVRLDDAREKWKENLAMNKEYKESIARQRAAETQMKLAEYQEKIDYYSARGETEKANTLVKQAQALYMQAKADGQVIDNSFKPALNQATISQRTAAANKANRTGGGGGRSSGGSKDKTVTQTKTDQYGNTTTTVTETRHGRQTKKTQKGKSSFSL